jgi:hypothetical protein
MSRYFKQEYLKLCLIPLFCSVLAIFTLGVATPYHRLAPNLSLSKELVTKWHPDLWLENKSTLDLKGIDYLSYPLTRLELNLLRWRPPHVGDAQVEVLFCGRKIGHFLVDSDTKVHLPLSFCREKIVTFVIKNPFQSGTTDNRDLGVKVASMRLFTPIGVPIVTFREVLFCTFLYLLPLIISAYAFVKRGIIGGVIGLLVISHLIAHSDIYGYEWENIASLYTVSLVLLVGSVIPKLTKLESNLDTFKYSKLALIVILLLALSLRVYGITFGLPAPFHPDETPKFNAIAGMLARGDWHPRYFLHPSLLLYLTTFLTKLGLWLEPTSELNFLVRFNGRVISALFGSGSVALLYLIGKRLYGVKEGLIAALLLAVMPLHVTCSRYMKEDVLMLFWILAVTLVVLKSIDEKRGELLLLAGLFAGFSFGTKYSGALSSLIIAGAPFLLGRRFSLWPNDGKFFRYALFAAFFMAIGFIITTPYIVLDFPSVLKGMESERNHMLRGHNVPIDAWSQYWMYHMWRSLLPGSGGITLLVGLLGVGFILRQRRVEDYWILGLLLLFYLPSEWVRSKPAPQAERYMVPVMPWLALLAGAFLTKANLARIRVPLTSLTLLSALLPTLLYARELNSDTRVRLKKWMLSNIPLKSRVAIDYPPYDPPLRMEEFQVVRFPPGQLLNSIAEGRLKNDADYLVLSSLMYDRFFSQPRGDGARRRVIRDTFLQMEILKEEVPSFRTYGFNNPRVTLFRVK